jgi:hypothetical protein
VEAAAPGSYAFTGTAQSTSLVMEAAGAAYVVTPTDTPLIRSGFDYEFQQGGIGHYLLEFERAAARGDHAQGAGRAGRADRPADVSAMGASAGLACGAGRAGGRYAGARE